MFFLSVGNQLFNAADIAVFTPDGYIYYAGRPSCVQIPYHERERVAADLLASKEFIRLECLMIVGLGAIEIIAPTEVQLRGQGMMRAVLLTASDREGLLKGRLDGFVTVGPVHVRRSEISTVTADGYVRLTGEGVVQKVSADEAASLMKTLTAGYQAARYHRDGSEMPPLETAGEKESDVAPKGGDTEGVLKTELPAPLTDRSALFGGVRRNEPKTEPAPTEGSRLSPPQDSSTKPPPEKKNG